MELYNDCDDINRPRILSMTYPLFQSTKDNMEHNDEVNDSENNASTYLNINDEKSSKIDITSIIENEVTDNDMNKSDETVKEPEKINDSSKVDQVDDVINIDSKLDDEINEGYQDSNNECAIDKVNEENVSKNEKESIVGGDCEKHMIADVKNNMMENIDEQESKDLEKSFCNIDNDNSLKLVYKNSDDFEMYEKLEWKIEEMEKQLCCELDLAEDIDGGKRYKD